VILGTAGHIDHGKTALVERLTGTRTDRLKEEQERGMTIDVGYAEFALPDGTEVGLLDVPGHERLVRTMVAGATAMDLALLVVAADDGPMPQTREHVEILDVLGVTRLVVALTKVDLVDDETLLIAQEEIEALLAPTGMRGAPVLRVSSQTGEGIDELRAAIAAALPPAREDPTQGQIFRMPLMRAFVAPGRGTVVTGIPLSGRLAVGEAVEVLPPGLAGRVRSIQVHKRPADEARAAQRTALSLSDVPADRVKRGMVLATAGVLKPARRLAARVRLLEQARPLRHGDRARLHVGAEQVVVRAHVLDGTSVAPGETHLVELEAFHDVVTAPGDRLVLRTENASDTIGGGEVVQVLARRLPRSRPGRVRSLLERSAHLHEPEALLLGELEAAGAEGTDAATVAARTALRPDGLGGWMDALVEREQGVRLGHGGQVWMAAAAWEKVLERIERGAARLHEKDRALESLPVSSVRTAAGRLPPAVLDAALDHLVSAGRLVREGRDGIRLASHASSLSDADRADLGAVRAALARGRGTPPAAEDLEADLGLTTPRVQRALRLLVNRGAALKAGDWYFDATWVEEAKQRLAAHAAEHGGFTPADARTLLETTRKWIIPLLETLDKSGFSRRTGDKRVVRSPGR